MLNYCMVEKERTGAGGLQITDDSKSANAKKPFRDKIGDLVHAPWAKVQKASKAVRDYVTEPPQNDDRSLGGKFRDAGVALITSPTVSFNGANFAFNMALHNKAGAVISAVMTAVSSGMTVLDSWKNRAESTSYKANAAYQATLGLTFLPKLAAGSPEALYEGGKGLALYGLATAGHWLRAGEEEEAKEAGKTMDEYYQAFSKGPARYSQSYYGATEVIAVSGQRDLGALPRVIEKAFETPENFATFVTEGAKDPKNIALLIALGGIGRALNDQKFWDAESGPLKCLRQATAPRIFTAGYAISGVTAALQGDWWFAASQAGWGWGNANFDLIGPKVKKAIRNRYANKPEQAQEAVARLEIIRAQTEQIKEETALMGAHIQGQEWDQAAREAGRLYDEAVAGEDGNRQTLYLETIRALAPASLTARKKLQQMGVDWEDRRFQLAPQDSTEPAHEAEPQPQV